MTYFGDLCGKVRDVHFLWVITWGKKKKGNCKMKWIFILMENHIIKEKKNKADNKLKPLKIDSIQSAVQTNGQNQA